MLREAAGCGGTQGARQPRRDAHPVAFHLGARVAPAGAGFGLFGEVHADLPQDGFGVGLDDLDALGRQHLEVGDVAGDEPCGLDLRRPLRGTARRRPARAGTAGGSVGHGIGGHGGPRSYGSRQVHLAACHASGCHPKRRLVRVLRHGRSGPSFRFVAGDEHAVRQDSIPATCAA